MGQPVVVAGDAISGTCSNHLVPGPAGAPTPAPGLPFRAPVVQGVVATVLAAGTPVAVAGATGMASPPHAGLHPSDPFFAPAAEIGTIMAGSSTVTAGGQALAFATASSTCCVVPGTLAGSAATVLLG
jgi:uncharacterized Zn-binding protein involved in type VI secretion